jgi:cation diffusion facilitator family transporter
MAGAGTGGESRGIRLALAAYTILFAALLGAYVATSLVVLLAEAFDTLSDVVFSGFLLLSFRLSQRSADEGHTYGHGRVQNVGALVAAMIFILFLSLETFRQAIPELLSPAATGEAQTDIGNAVTVFGLLLTIAPFVATFRSTRSGAAARAQFVALVENLSAYVVALVGLVLVSYGIARAGAASSIIIGVLILASGLYLLKENADVLIGRAPPPEFLQGVRTTALAVPGVLGLHDLRAEYIGPGSVSAGLHIEGGAGTPIEEADRIAEEVQARVAHATGCRYCVVHVDPFGDPLGRGVAA